LTHAAPIKKEPLSEERGSPNSAFFVFQKWNTDTNGRSSVELIGVAAEFLPFPDASFDFVSMGYALRHISDLRRAFSEFHRVLKPGGKICLLEITCPESAWGRLLLKIYMKGWVPLLAPFFGHKRNTAKLWRYYWDTVEACLPPAQVVAELEAAGFAPVRRYIDVRAMSILAEFQAGKAS